MRRKQRRWASSAPPLRDRLMEKPGAATTTHRHNHDATAWGEKGGGEGGGGTQHTQYIRRLADLRDELINQEETALARALDRLRLHSINNRDAARYRLKIKEPVSESPRVAGLSTPGGHGPSYPRPMVTTVEKFRQMRPQRRAPIIFPLQGKQLIESHSPSNGSHLRTPSAQDDLPPPPPPPRVEDTVKANLQRLIQPTSSIPNIGRKALRQESLELRTQPVYNMRSRVYKSNQRPHLASPFTMMASDDEGGGAESRAGSDRDGLQLSPHSYKLGPMTDGDRIDMDKLNQYYYICCLPNTPASREGGGHNNGNGGGGGGGGGNGDRSRSMSMSTSSPRQGQQQQHKRGLSRLGGQRPQQRCSSEKVGGSQHQHQNHSPSGRPYSDRSSMAGGMAVSSDDVETPRYYRHSVGGDSSVNGVNGGGGGGSSDRVPVLPVIHADGESPTFPPQHPHHNHPHHHLPHGNPNYAFLTQNQRACSSSPDAGDLGGAGQRRRTIVVDMPHIIFNAATPDLSREPLMMPSCSSAAAAAAALAVEGLPPPEQQQRPGALSKTLKQNEIRHREVQNLLEDVKELNKRTETLTTTALSTEQLDLDAPGAWAAEESESS